MKFSFSCPAASLLTVIAWRNRAAVASLAGVITAFSSVSSAAPRYESDSSFHRPIFTAVTQASKVTKLPDDSFLLFTDRTPQLAFGTFHRVNGETYGGLVRYTAEGLLDPTFKIDQRLQGYLVTAAASAPDGKIVIAAFPRYTAVESSHQVFRLESDGTLDTSFDAGTGTSPGARGLQVIQAIVVSADNKILLGGYFGDFSGSGRGYLVRLNHDGGIDSSFKAVAFWNSSGGDRGIVADTGIKIQPDGRVLIAGAFTELNGVARLGLARLHADGSLDASFVPAGYNPAGSFSSSRRPVRSIDLQKDGKVLIGGEFNPVSGAPPQLLVRLNGDGSLDQSFSAARTGSTSNVARSVRLLADERILVAAFDGILRYENNGTLDAAFSSSGPTFSSAARPTTAVDQERGTVIFAGGFSSVGGVPHPGFARLKPDGALDLSFAPGEYQVDRLPAQLARRTDGTVVVTGSFDRVDGKQQPGIALLKTDGSLSASTLPQDLSTLYPSSVFLSGDDKLVVYGPTYRVLRDGPFTYRRLNADGTADPTFSRDPAIPQFDHVLPQVGGRLLLSPGMSTQAVVKGELLTRMLPDGTRDNSFQLGIDVASLVVRDDYGAIYEMYDGDNRALAVLPDGKILFKYFDGANYKVVRLHADGAVDPSFQVGTASPRRVLVNFPQVYDPRTDRVTQPPEGVYQPTSTGPVRALIEADGRIVLAGQFTSYNGVAAGGIARVNADGSLSSTFGSGAAFAETPVQDTREPSVTAVEADFGGGLLVAGDFELMHGTRAPGLARLTANGSVDTGFEAPVFRRITGTARTPTSILLREGPGRFLSVGNYTATAGSNAVISILRVAIPLRAVSMFRTPQNSLRLTFSGVPGEYYSIERADSLASWPPGSGVAVLQADTAGSVVYEDATAFSSLQRFYRAVALP